MKHTLKQIQLQPDDLLFFVHIPKTGGLSFVELIQRPFTPEQIFSLHAFVERQVFAQFTPSQYARYRLVRGHFRAGSYGPIAEHIAFNPICITMLREPIARIISFYHYIRRTPHDPLHKMVTTNQLTLHEFVTRPESAFHITNQLVFWIAGAVFGNLNYRPDQPWIISDQARLEIAKQRLMQFAFVGLTEAYKASVELLAYTFYWPQPQAIPHHNAAPSQNAPVDISQSTLEAIQSRAQLDIELYTFAQQVFEQRINQMRGEKKQRSL